MVTGLNGAMMQKIANNITEIPEMKLLKRLPDYSLVKFNNKIFAVFEEHVFIKKHGEIPLHAILFSFEGMSYVAVSHFKS